MIYVWKPCCLYGFKFILIFSYRQILFRVWPVLDRFTQTQKVPLRHWPEEDSYWKTAATYSPTLYRSTIGVSELNFSVRNGKRWNLTAITTWISFSDLLFFLSAFSSFNILKQYSRTHSPTTQSTYPCKKADGQLVVLGFGVATFTPAPYQRCRLQRPWEI